MKKSDFTGWREVFRFSFEQGLKQKSYKVFLILICIVGIALMPAITFFTSLSSDEGPGVSEVSKVIVYDESELNIDYTKAFADERYRSVVVEKGAADGFDTHVNKLIENELSDEILAHITFNEMGLFDVTFVKAKDAPFDSDDYSALTADFTDFFSTAKMFAVDVTEEQMAFINQPVNSTVKNVSTTGELLDEEPENEGISMDVYTIFLVGLTVVTMLINICGSYIATSIVTEKSTRVVEYLMINVRPMALIVGKILANLLLVVIQFAAILVSIVASYGLNIAIFGMTDSMQSTLEQVGGALAVISNASPITILVTILIILAGILFYSIVAGIAGASVSKLEEMAEGLKTYQMLVLLGSYLGIFLCIMQLTGSSSADMLTIAVCIFPLSAPFVAPANLLAGMIPMGYALIGLALVLLLAAGMFIFASRVYESLLFYNGKVLKFKDIMAIAKNRKAVTKEVK